MRILFLVHAFNSLSQRLHVELASRGHELAVEFDVNDASTRGAVTRFGPDLVLAPYLKRAIPESVWRRHTCLVVHPGPPGDRGPAALDWAVLHGERAWGVTVLQAEAEMDAGPIWAHRRFSLRDAAKSSLYRHEVTEAAVAAVLEAVDKFADGGFEPRPQDPAAARVRPAVPQSARAVDWARDETATILRRIRSADGVPGLRDELEGRVLYLYDAHPEPVLRGTPGALLARCGPAVCRATVDGALWIGHLRDPSSEHPFKLPAVQVLGKRAERLPLAEGYHEIRYEERGRVGLIHFPFYNGAMSTDQCRALLRVYRAARRRPVRVLVLFGGEDFWSNGMHLNRIEAADSPADESWRNINALDDLAQAILETDDRITVAALHGNAGAGGVYLARAADLVWARRGVILNPHYKDMGNLYGSEFWTYSLPRRVGMDEARRIMARRLPMGVDEARDKGLVDEVIDARFQAFQQAVIERALALADRSLWRARMAAKRRRLRAEVERKPFAAYRAEELAHMWLDFYGFDPSYHVARHHFVHKVPKARTPLTLAPHRRPVALRRSAT